MFVLIAGVHSSKTVINLFDIEPERVKDEITGREKIVLNVENKAQAAKDYNIEVFIDDSMKNCNQLSESGIKTYVFDTRINENIECDSKIKRVYSWLHLNQELESYMNK